MPNMDSIVKAHNTKILKKKDETEAKEEKACNCRNKASCPVGNDCLKTNVVYKATVQHENKISKLHWDDWKFIQDTLYPAQVLPQAQQK